MIKEVIMYGSQITLSSQLNENYFICDQGEEIILSGFEVQQSRLNFQQCVFRIIPVLSHEWVTELVNLDLDTIESQTLQDRKMIIENLEQHFNEEMQANNSCLEKVQYNSVLFETSSFHLLHVDSMRFLSLGESVKLVDFPNDYCILNFEPIYQFQRRLQQVSPNEYVRISTSKLVNSRKIYLYHTKDQQIKSSLEQKSSFQVGVYCVTEVDLNVGDVVAINLSDTDLFLNARQPYDIFTRIVEYQLDLLKYKETRTLNSILFEDLTVSFDDVIERVGVKRVQKLQNTAYWRFENQNRQGGPIKWFTSIRIRHNQSGRYLELYQGKPVLTDYATENALFKLIPMEQSQALSKESYFQIKHQISGAYLTPQSIDMYKLLRVKCIGFQENWETKQLQSFVPHLLNALDLLDQLQTEHHQEAQLKVQFYQAYLQVKCALNYAQNFVKNSIITNISPHHKFGILCPIRQDLIRHEKLFPLICLMLFKVQPDDEQSLSSMLSAQEEQEFYTQGEFTTKKSLHTLNTYFQQQICTLQIELHETIRLICEGNNKNQLMFFQFLPIFYQQMVNYPSFTRLVTQLITNSEIIHELSKIKAISDSNESIFLKKMTQSLRQNKVLYSRPDILKFLATTCSIGIQAVYPNQDIIFKTLHEDQKLLGYALMNHSYQKEKGLMLSTMTYNGTFIDIPMERYMVDTVSYHEYRYEQQIEYFKCQLFLYQQLSLGRNYSFYRKYIERLPYHAILPLVSNKEINSQIRAHFYSLCKNLYIDREPYAFTQKPNLIRIIGNTPLFQFESDDEIVQEEDKEVLDIILRFKSGSILYLDAIVQKLRAGQFLEEAFSSLTLEIIRILHMLLQFGLLQTSYSYQTDEEQLERLLLYLEYLLEYDFDYNKVMDKQKKNNQLQKLKTLGLFTKSKVNIQQFKVENHREPILMKMSNVKKVLSRFENKTYSLLTEQKQDEIQIKIEICKVISYLLDLRQDYLINNAIAYFEQNMQKTQKQRDYVNLLREDYLLPGQKLKQIKFKTYSKQNSVKHFDQILERPFIDGLLISFFFATDPELQNQIIYLTEKFSKERNQFKDNLNSVQLLISEEQQSIYQVMLNKVQKLKNNVQDAQVWLSLDNDIYINGRNEETMEKVMERLQSLQQLLQQSINEGNDNVVGKMFLNIGGFSITHSLMEKCLVVIDLNMDLLQQLDYDENLYYKQELCEKIVQIIKVCVLNIQTSTKFDYKQQQFIFSKVAKVLLRYVLINVGQIELLIDILRANKFMIPSLTTIDLEYMVDYIKVHGRYPEFLELLYLLVDAGDLGINQDLLSVMLDTGYYLIDPFGDNYHHFERFYLYPPQQDEYKQKFILILERIISGEVGVSLRTKLLDMINFEELINYLLQKTQDMSNPNLEFDLQKDIIKIKRTVCQLIVCLIKYKKKLLLKNEHTLLLIVHIEHQWLDDVLVLNDFAKQYISNELLELLNIFNEYKRKKNSDRQCNTQLESYAESILHHYESLSLVNPYQVHRFLISFDLVLPEIVESTIGPTLIKEPQTKEISLRQSVWQNTEDDQWAIFKKNFNSSEQVRNRLSVNKVAKAIWNMNSIYLNNNQSRVKLTNDDLLKKILVYLQFWKNNKAPIQNVIFILRVLMDLLELDKLDFFDSLGITNIIIVLIWEENETENEYIKDLLNILRELMKSENARKSALFQLQNSLQSDRFFSKFEQLLNGEIELSITVLEIMESMCKEPEMQNLLRCQTNNKNSYDLVSLTILLIVKQSQNIIYLLQALNTLFALITGPCRMNQIVTSNSKFIEFSIKLLNDPKCMPDLTTAQMIRLTHQCLQILLTLTEMTTKEIDPIIVTLRRIIPLSVLTNHYLQVYQKFIKLYGEDKYTKKVFIAKNNFVLESGFNAYFLSCILKQQDDVDDDFEHFQESNDKDLLEEFLQNNILKELTTFGKQIIEHGQEQILMRFGNLKQIDTTRVLERQEQMKKAQQFYRKNTLKVQYVRNEQLSDVYFAKQPCFYLYPDKLTQEFQDLADRTSTKSKLTYLLNMTDQIYRVLKHQERLLSFFTSHKILNIFARRGLLWRQLAFYNGLSINILILLSYDQRAFSQSLPWSQLNYLRLNQPYLFGDPTNYNTQSIIYILGYCNLYFNFLIIFFYLIDKAPVKIGYIWDQYDSNQAIIGKIISVFLNFIFSVIALVIDFDIMYYLLQIVMNIIGILVHPFFFAFHLIDVLYLEPLIPILCTAWYAKWKILGLLFLAVIYLYYQSILSYSYYYFFYMDERGKRLCDKLWLCVFITYDWTFKTDGSVGQIFDQTASKQEMDTFTKLNSYYSLYFYDMITSVSMRLFLKFMMLAIIIVQFLVIRLSNKIKSHDQNYVCFICGIERKVFERQSRQGFYKHITNEHSAWNYIYYICYLHMKPDHELTGTDLHIKQKIAKQDIGWFPIKRAISLSDKQIEIDSVHAKNNDLIHKQVKLLTNIKRQLQDSIL